MNVDIAEIILMLVPMILSLSVHEWAHAISAYKLGDDTAAREGRLTLNPLPHIDPIGTLLLPALLTLSGTGFLFGWARPVPVNPLRFTRKLRMKTSMLITAAAGPVSNLLLAFLALLGLKVLGVGTDESITHLLMVTVSLNLALAVFNMIPVPPLDGHKVLMGVLPDTLGRKLDEFMSRNAAAAPMMLMVVILFAGSILVYPIQWLAQAMVWLVGGF